MSDPIVWENIPKNQTDPTTIGEAIDDQLDAHNADSEAHMAELAALGAHRENPTIDHPAESAPNDKLTPDARAFTAIVGGNDPENYATVEDAVLAAVAAGGGLVLLKPGIYELGELVELPAGVDLAGTDPEMVTIETNSSEDAWFLIPTRGANDPVTQRISNITFINNTGIVFETGSGSNNVALHIIMSNCFFKGGTRHIDNSVGRMSLEDCILECGYTGAVRTRNELRLIGCTFTPYDTTDVPMAITRFTTTTLPFRIYLRDCTFDSDTAGEPDWFGLTTLFTWDMQDCLIEDCRSITTNTSNNRFINNTINFLNNERLNVSNPIMTTVQRNQIQGNSLVHGGSVLSAFRFGSENDNSVCIGNVIRLTPADDGGNNVIANNVIV